MQEREIERNNNHAPKVNESAVRDFAQQVWSGKEVKTSREPQNTQVDKSLPEFSIDGISELNGHGQPAKDRLGKLFDKSFDKDTKESFSHNMGLFESRAKANGVSKEEVAETYNQIGRILTASGDKPLTPELRKQVVGEILNHLAKPEIISQGQHNTCNVTAVEVRAYSLHPSKAAKLVADVATTGEYTTPGGIKVKLDALSMVPDKEAQESAPKLGLRDYATQLFNLAAVNVWYSAAKPEWQYQQRIEKNEKTHKEHVREQIVDHSKGKEKPVLYPGSKTPLDGPTLAADQIAFINDAIVGKHEPYAVLRYGSSSVVLPGEKAQKVHAADIGTNGLNGESDFRTVLQKLKETHQLPAIAAVNTGVYPLNEDDGAGVYGYESGGHVVSITDFTGGKDPHVSMDNEWSSKQDHPNNSVSMHDMYLCMGGQDEAMKDAAYETIDAEIKHGVAPVAEMAKLAQTPRMFGVDAQFAKDIAQKVTDLTASERTLTGEQRHKWFAQLRFSVNSTNAEDKVGLLNKIQASGALTPAELGWLAAESAKSIHHQKKVACDNNDVDRKRACVRATTQIAEFVVGLPGETKKHYFAKLRENG